MPPIRRCHACGDHFRPSPDRRHGRIRCRHTANPDVTLPDLQFVCADCRETVVDLPRHWEQRDAIDDTCSFCDSTATDTGRVDLTSLVDDRVVSQGRYHLCRECEQVFETFLEDLHVSIDLPDPWTHTPASNGAVFDREGDLRVETTPLTAEEPRLRFLIEESIVAEAVPVGPPRARAREFVAAFESFYPTDPQSLADDVIEGNPDLRTVRSRGRA